MEDRKESITKVHIEGHIKGDFDKNTWKMKCCNTQNNKTKWGNWETTRKIKSKEPIYSNQFRRR